MSGLPRRRKPQDEFKRTKTSMRLRAEILDYLAAQAASSRRSLSEEIDHRLETSRLADDAWGGPRVVAYYESWRRLRPSTAAGSTITQPSIWFVTDGWQH